MWTIGHCIRLPEIQYICPRKAIHSGVRPQATGNDISEEPCQCAFQTPEDVTSATAIQCDHQVQTRKDMLLTDALSRGPSHASGEIKLDMRVDYIAFSKTWIPKLRKTTREDPILSTVYQLTQQEWPLQRRHTLQMARVYWDFRDQLSTDEGLLLMGPHIVIPPCLCEEYLEKLHHGHLSATKVQQNACQHLYLTTCKDARNVSIKHTLPKRYYKPMMCHSSLGMHSNGSLLCEWQVVCIGLWLFHHQFCQLEGPSTGAVRDRRHPRWDHEWQWPSLQWQGV